MEDAGLTWVAPATQVPSISNGLHDGHLSVLALPKLELIMSFNRFPLSHREVGVAVSVGLNLFFAALLSLFYLP